MADHVGQRLLGDAEALDLDLGGQVDLRRVGGEAADEPREPRRAIQVRSHRGHQPQFIQHGRPEVQRDAAHLLEHAIDQAVALPQVRRRRTRVGAHHRPLQIDPDRRERLADLVVQLAGDAAPLLLLGPEQLTGEGRIPLASREHLAEGELHAGWRSPVG